MIHGIERFDYAAAAWAFYSLHHRGQSCDMYRRLCLIESIGFRPGAMLGEVDIAYNPNGEWYEANEIYRALCEKHDITYLEEDQVSWDDDEPLCDRGIEVPEWIDQDITGSTVCAIQQGGCESGAYMPAVTYHEALETMSEHSDDILETVESVFGCVTMWEEARRNGVTWDGVACWFVSNAVEIWAAQFEVVE